MGIPVQYGHGFRVDRSTGKIYLSSYIDRKLSNEYSGKKRLALQVTLTKRLCKVRENKIYGIPKSLVIWVSPSNMAS